MDNFNQILTWSALVGNAVIAIGGLYAVFSGFFSWPKKIENDILNLKSNIDDLRKGQDDLRKELKADNLELRREMNDKFDRIIQLTLQQSTTGLLVNQTGQTLKQTLVDYEKEKGTPFKPN